MTAIQIKPDLDFVNDIQVAGGPSAKTCQQCATCSVMCPLAPEEHPYPRKEMVWAAWGMKDMLMGDPDIWLCHQCGDCATNCTRGSSPSDVMSGLRLQAIEYFAVPGFMGRWLRHPRYLPALIGISVAFVIALVGLQLGWMGEENTWLWANAEAPESIEAEHHRIWPDQQLHYEFEHFLQHKVINILFPLAFFTMVGCALMSARKFWTTIDGVAGDWGTGPKQSLLASLIGAVIDLAKHNRFHRCDASKPRWSAHLLVFYGFMGLFVVTGIATILTVIELFDERLQLYPLGWLNPVKMAGNLAGLSMIAGCLYVIVFRFADPEKTGAPTYNDWLFVGLLLTVALTGFGAELVRIGPLPLLLATPIYLAHLLSVFWLLIFFPYSKFAHAMYRYLAMAHARRTGRPLPAPPA